MVLPLSRQATVLAAVAKGLAEHGPKSRRPFNSINPLVEDLW
jgi:hypothetical protein